MGGRGTAVRTVGGGLTLQTQRGLRLEEAETAGGSTRSIGEEEELRETGRAEGGRANAAAAVGTLVTWETETILLIEIISTGKRAGAIGMEEVAIQTLGAGGGI